MHSFLPSSRETFLQSFLKVVLWVFSLFLIFLVAAPAAWSQGTQVERRKGTTTAAYGFLEYLPPDYNVDATKLFPTIVFLHGVGEKGNGTTDLYKVANGGPPKLIKDNKWPVKSPKTGLYPAENFIVISIQSNDGYPLPDNLHTFIKWVKTNYRADPDRTYLCGLSAGGVSTWRYIDKHSDEVAAIIPVCGNGNISGSDECAYKHVPLWAFHGDSDPTVNWGGSTNPVRLINLCTPKPNPLAQVTIYPGAGHDVWTRTYSLTGMSETTDPKYHAFDMSIYDWLLQFKRGAVPSLLPTANAGADVILTLPVSSTNITGTGTPGSGTISSYAWTKISGPAATITNASSPTVSLSGLVVGIYTFRLTVTNSSAQTATDDVKVTVVAANLPPVANAGPDKPITLPTNSLTLNGTGTDVDGTIASYTWAKVSGPAGGTLSGQTTANLGLSGLVQGTYVFSLTVKDNQGASATDNVTVTVNPAAVNQVPVANAGVDKTLNLPTNTVNLTGSGSDADGSIVSYSWIKVSGPAATLTNASTATLSLSGLVAGNYVFRITVTDNVGASATDDAAVTVIAANQSPVANANSDITITLPTNTTTVTGSGNDPDGSIAAYAWTQVSGPNTATLANATTATLTASNLIAGTYIFRLTITDDKGSTGFDDMKVIVNAAPVNSPPTANAGPDKTITLPTNSIILNGTGTDIDGTITYAWTKVSGPTASLSNQTTPNLTASALVAGTYVFKLTVTDNQSASASDNVTVTVQPAVVNQAPVANAGTDINLTLPTNSTTITGSATDADGTIASYAWTKVSGPTSGTLTGQTTATLQLSSLVAGTYVFQLTATDDKGATGSDNVSVIVNAANVAPAANAGADITINLPANSTMINGSGTDPDGSISSYAWTQVSGPSTATLVNANAAAVNISSMVAGTYTFRLTVTDNSGATGTDDVKVIVNAANQTPTANAGASKSITLPTTVANFTGSGTDPDGTIASYAWTKVSGPTASLANQNTATVTVTATTDGVYVFRLTVTDNQGASDFDDVTLTVNAAAVNQLPIANAGANQNITLPVNSLNLTGSGSDPDGSIASYLWSKVSGPTASLTNQATPTVSLSALIEGTYVFRLTVTDNSGATAFDDVTVTVLPAAVNQPPVANAGTDKTIVLPANSITIFGTASDADGTVSSYQWSLISGPAATIANETTPNVTLTNMVQGTYILRLTVTDDDGATDTDDITIVVNSAAVNQAPVADAGADKSLSLPTNAVVLSGSGSDADGTISSYTWVKVSGPAVTTGLLNQPALSLSNLVEGVYVFRLQVTDDDGADDTDDVTVTVQPAAVNQPPVVSAGADKSIFLPANNVTLIGSATDADGSITTLLWTKVSGGTATLANVTTTILTASDLIEGTYVFRLTGTDDDGASAFDDVTVVVNAASANKPPVADAGSDITVKLPTTSATVSGSGSDQDGVIATFLWTKVSGPSVTVANETTATLSLTNLVEGIYVFELTVTDNNGDSHSDQVTVTVLPASLNTPPTVDAGGDLSLKLPENSTTIFATVLDSDGTIAEYTWSKVSGPAATMTNGNTATLNLADLVVGTYVFRLDVKDNGGLTAFDEVTVTVLPEITVPLPTVDAGEDQIVQLPDNTIDIEAVANAETLIASYEWTQIEGNPVAFIPDVPILSLAGLTAGRYSFRVLVRDDLGQEAADEVIVTVREPVVQPFNVFSPNNDDTPDGDNIDNDTWTIVNAEKLEGCDITVYNRQGQKVYYSKGYSVPWDGTSNGKQLPDGVYFYVIKCTGEGSTNGSVTIIR